MWTLSKRLKLSSARSELEAVILERTAELQQLSQHLLKVQDEERRKIARDLHDSTGQTLAALKITISFLQESCKKDPASLAIVSEIVQLADQASEEIRTMSYLLHPPLLDEVGFACAARWFIEGFAKRSGIKVNMDFTNSQERLAKEMEIALFRVLQESLINVHRHSGASEASIRFQYEGDAVMLEIRDFGRGITERLHTFAGSAAHSGVGLTGMRERMNELHGQFDIEDSGNGTIVRAAIPLRGYPINRTFPSRACSFPAPSERAGA
jgi:two-component system, NarL family, sensor kinase